MPPVDSHSQPPRFRVWMRRLAVAENPFALRFEVQDGKGILRVPRPGVLIDPPARKIGLEERLTFPQLRGTRFIVVWDGGRARQGHALNHLDEASLDRVEADRWTELEVTVDGGFRNLVLPVGFAAPPAPAPQRKSNRPSLSELRQALDSLTYRTEDDEDPDSALDTLTGPVAPANAAPAEVERVELPPAVDPPVVKTEAPPVRVPPTHEVGRSRGGERRAAPARSPVDDAEAVPEPRALGTRAGPPPVRLPPPPPLAMPEPEDQGAEALALGEADEHDDDALALALGEADEHDESALALPLGGSEPVANDEEPGAEEPSPGDDDGPPASRPEPAGFTDDDEEAAFSIDLPSHRRSTEYVNVLGAGDDRHTTLDGSFAREELPPMDDLAIPVAEADEEAEVPVVGAEGSRGAGVFDQPGAPPAPSGRTTRRARVPLAPDSAPTVVPEADLDDSYRATTSLVRHLRRQTAEQRRRIAELEAENADLRARLASKPGRR